MVKYMLSYQKRRGVEEGSGFGVPRSLLQEHDRRAGEGEGEQQVSNRMLKRLVPRYPEAEYDDTHLVSLLKVGSRTHGTACSKKPNDLGQV